MMRECAKCNSSQIEEGYLIDHGYGEKHVAGFQKGQPDKRWYGLKAPKNERTLVKSYRCTRCGYLESYAKPQN